MPKTRHTLWIDAKDLRGHDRYTVKNPRFRVWMMIVAILVVTVGLVLMFVFMPSSDSLSVHFSSIPDRAEVFIDGESVGQTPCEMNLDKGDYVLRMEAEGYLPVSEPIDVTESNRSFSIVFTEGKSEVAFVSSPDEVKVYVDDQYIGTTPFVYRDAILDEPVTIKAEKSGYYSVSQIETLSGIEEYKIKLEQIMVDVYINTEPPDAELFIDSRHVGTTPWSAKLYFGEHHIRIAKEGGYRIIEETIEVKSNLEVTYPLESVGIAIHGVLGETHTPGAKVYVIPLIASVAMENTSPWAVEQTTPVQLLAEDMAAYLTHKEIVPDQALIVGMRSESSASAGMKVVDVNSVGEIEETEIDIRFPESAQVDFLGQTLDGIGWFSLLSEKLSPAGLIENNPRYARLDGSVVDRDNPSRFFDTGGRSGLVVISPDHDYLAVVGGGMVTVFSSEGQLTSTVGETAVFGDGAIYICDEKRLKAVNLLTQAVQFVDVGIEGDSLQQAAGFLLVQNVDSATVVVDLETMRVLSWTQLLEDEYPYIAPHFIPEGMFSRSVAGEHHVLALGKVFGLKVLFGLGEKPCLLNVWFDNTPLRLEDTLTDQGT